MERDRNHIPTFDIATGRRHPAAIDPNMPHNGQRCGRAAGAHDSGVPQPPVDPLPVCRHDTAASAALLGVRLQLGLEGRKLGKRRVWVSLLLALAKRRVIATILVIGPGLREMRPLAARALGTITLTFGTVLGAMISLAPLAAVVAFAPEFALRPARAAMTWSFLFGWRTGVDDRFCPVRRRNGALLRCVRGWRPIVPLVRALPLGRAPLAAPLFAAAAWAPHIDELRLRRRPGHLRQLRMIDRGSAR
jgi:hypothetical protein